MKKRIVLVLALSMFCILAMTTTAFAADKGAQEQAAPQFSAYVMGGDEIPLLVNYYDLGAARTEFIRIIGVGLTIQGTTAYAYGECKTYDTCDIALKMELQQYANNKWTTIATYNGSDKAKEFDLSKSRTISKNYSYQVKLTATVNNREIVTKYSSIEVCE